MSLALAIKIIQFLRLIAPMIPELYATVKAAFPNATGLVKFEAFTNQLRGYVADAEELKPFVPVLEQAIPRLKTLVDDYHKDINSQGAAPIAQPAAPAAA
jgi:hypothetical protein